MQGQQGTCSRWLPGGSSEQPGPADWPRLGERSRLPARDCPHLDLYNRSPGAMPCRTPRVFYPSSPPAVATPAPSQFSAPKPAAQ